MLKAVIQLRADIIAAAFFTAPFIHVSIHFIAAVVGVTCGGYSKNSFGICRMHGIVHLFNGISYIASAPVGKGKSAARSGVCFAVDIGGGTRIKIIVYLYAVNLIICEDLAYAAADKAACLGA